MKKHLLSILNAHSKTRVAMLLMTLAIWVGAKTEISFGHQPPIALRPAPAPERFNVSFYEHSGPLRPTPVRFCSRFVHYQRGLRSLNLRG